MRALTLTPQDIVNRRTAIYAEREAVQGIADKALFQHHNAEAAELLEHAADALGQAHYLLFRASQAIRWGNAEGCTDA